MNLANVSEMSLSHIQCDKRTNLIASFSTIWDSKINSIYNNEGQLNQWKCRLCFFKLPQTFDRPLLAGTDMGLDTEKSLCRKKARLISPGKHRSHVFLSFHVRRFAHKHLLRTDNHILSAHLALFSSSSSFARYHSLCLPGGLLIDHLSSGMPCSRLSLPPRGAQHAIGFKAC